MWRAGTREVCEYAVVHVPAHRHAIENRITCFNCDSVYHDSAHVMLASAQLRGPLKMRPAGMPKFHGTMSWNASKSERWVSVRQPSRLCTFTTRSWTFRRCSSGTCRWAWVRNGLIPRRDRIPVKPACGIGRPIGSFTPSARSCVRRSAPSESPRRDTRASGLLFPLR